MCTRCVHAGRASTVPRGKRPAPARYRQNGLACALEPYSVCRLDHRHRVFDSRQRPGREQVWPTSENRNRFGFRVTAELGQPLHDSTFVHHERNAFRCGDIGERVARYGDNIGDVAGRK
jgi:hypothetical protein